MQAVHLVLPCLLAACASVPAAAQSLGPTFTVPVEIKDLHPALKRGRVACFINPAQTSTAAEPVASGTTEFPLVNQAFAGEVLVRTHYAPGMSSAMAKHWNCRVEVHVRIHWHALAGYVKLPETKPGLHTAYNTVVQGSF